MDQMTGAEELRAVVRVLNDTTESALDNYSAEQLIKLVRSCWASEWDCYPDQLTTRQQVAAIEGKAPDWTDDSMDTPVYR